MASLLRTLSFSRSTNKKVSERACKAPQCDKEILRDASCEIHAPIHSKNIDQQILALQTRITEVSHDEAGVTWYTLESSSSILQTRCTTKRRFREFSTLHDKIVSVFDAHHHQLLSNLPKFPAKAVKLVSDHQAEEFLESRLEGLRTWLRKVVEIPHVASNLHLHAFLGLCESEDVLLASEITKILITDFHIEGKVVFYHVDSWARRQISNDDENPEDEIVFRTYSRYSQMLAFNEKLRSSISYAPPSEEVPSTPSPGALAPPSYYPLYCRFGHAFDEPASFKPSSAEGKGEEKSDSDDGEAAAEGASDVDSDLPVRIRYHSPIVSEDLVEEMPEFPMKRLRILENHTDDEFIKSRMVLFNSYFRKLLRLPMLGRHIVVLRFAGAASRDFTGIRVTG